MHIHCYSDKQLFKSTIILRNSWCTNCFLGFARVTSEHGLHITDSNNQSEPRTAIDHKSPEQILSETIVRKLQSNNRLLQICVIIASIALGIAIFWGFEDMHQEDNSIKHSYGFFGLISLLKVL